MAISRSQSIFKYKTIKGPLHKVPALLKLILLLPLSILCMSLPPFWLAAGIIIAAIAAFICKFTLREQLTDLKPAFFYALLMYALSVFSNLFELTIEVSLHALSFLTPHFSFILLPQLEFLRIALRLVLIVQLSSLLFRTTSSMEIREALRIEAISLFLCFIPQIFDIWASINLAWKARGGKQGLNKIKTTVFILISLSMEKAAVRSKALAARRISNEE